MSSAPRGKAKESVVAISVHEFWRRLKQAGVQLPDNCRRIIIDAEAGQALKVYFECFANNDLAEVSSDILKIVFNNPAKEATAHEQENEKA